MPRESSAASDRWAPLLERQTSPALIIGPDRKILAANAGFRARFSQGKDPTGRLCSELMHHSTPPCDGAGGHCPLDSGATDETRHVHRHLGCLGSAYEEVSARQLTDADDSRGAFLVVSKPLPRTTGSRFFVGSSSAILRLLDKVTLAAAEDGAVLIRGEPGTGRCEVGRLLHELSARAAGPFVPVDCSAVEASRLETLFFGRPEQNDNADATDLGLLSKAQGGSLFVREPHLLPPSVQRRIGRLLKSRDPGCRWLFAVNQASASPRGALRAALESSLPLLVPPLRDRLADLPVLLDTLASRLCGPHPPSLDPAVAEVLATYSFPGNLRELECLVEGACLEARGNRLRPEDFPPHVLTG